MRAYTEIRKPALKHSSRAAVASFVDVVGFGVDYRVRPYVLRGHSRGL
jgi:hypothetical protein